MRTVEVPGNTVRQIAAIAERVIGQPATIPIVRSMLVEALRIEILGVLRATDETRDLWPVVTEVYLGNLSITFAGTDGKPVHLLGVDYE